MQGWLLQWGVPAASATSGADMPGHNMPGHDMPGGGGIGDMPGMGGGGHGMMSDADMAALQNAQGADAGRLFLEQMIEHHEGAIVMAQQEIDEMQTLLAKRTPRVGASAGRGRQGQVDRIVQAI